MGATGTTWGGLFAAIGDRVIDVVTGRRIRRIEETLIVTSSRLDAIGTQLGAYADTVEGVRTEIASATDDIRGDLADLKAQIEAGQTPDPAALDRIEANLGRLGSGLTDLGTAGDSLRSLAEENPTPAPTDPGTDTV